jgi:hypothetical protein
MALEDLIADMIREQQNTTAAIVSLAEAIANAGKTPARKAKESTDRVIEKATEVAASATAYAEAKAITTEPPTTETVNQIDDPADEIPVSYEDAKAVILELSKAKGREAALEVLARFGVSKLPDLDVAHYAAVTAAAREALQ